MKNTPHEALRAIHDVVYTSLMSNTVNVEERHYGCNYSCIRENNSCHKKEKNVRLRHPRMGMKNDVAANYFATNIGAGYTLANFSVDQKMRNVLSNCG